MAGENTEWDGDGEDASKVVNPPPGATEPATPEEKAPVPEPQEQTRPQNDFYRTTAQPQPEHTHNGDPEKPATKPTEIKAIAVPDPLPNDITKCYSIFNALRASRNKEDKKNLTRVRQHISRIQQGLPPLNIGATEYSKGHSGHAAALKNQRRELLARQDIVVKELLDEYNQRGATINELLKQNADLQIENKTLKAKLK